VTLFDDEVHVKQKSSELTHPYARVGRFDLRTIFGIGPVVNLKKLSLEGKWFRVDERKVVGLNTYVLN
jgi:hypothetical protein